MAATSTERLTLARFLERLRPLDASWSADATALFEDLTACPSADPTDLRMKVIGNWNGFVVMHNEAEEMFWAKGISDDVKNLTASLKSGLDALHRLYMEHGIAVPAVLNKLSNGAREAEMMQSIFPFDEGADFMILVRSGRCKSFGKFSSDADEAITRILAAKAGR